jgi:SAM-dependent methyltransferase
MSSNPSLLAFKYLFDGEFYLRTYPDLPRAGIRTQAQAVAHWLTYGQIEKRKCGLEGVEIGGAAHNMFFLDTINVDYCTSMETVHKKEEFLACGRKLAVDVAAQGESLPFKDKSFDFILSSHVIEHFFDPIAALREWKRVARKYLFIIVPHKDRTPDRVKPLTSLSELIDRHDGRAPRDFTEGHHYSVWDTQRFLELCRYCGLTIAEWRDTDDKVGNGFAVVISCT